MHACGCCAYNRMPSLCSGWEYRHRSEDRWNESTDAVFPLNEDKHDAHAAHTCSCTHRTIQRTPPFCSRWEYRPSSRAGRNDSTETVFLLNEEKMMPHTARTHNTCSCCAYNAYNTCLVFARGESSIVPHHRAGMREPTPPSPCERSSACSLPDKQYVHVIYGGVIAVRVVSYWETGAFVWMDTLRWCDVRMSSVTPVESCLLR